MPPKTKRQKRKAQQKRRCPVQIHSDVYLWLDKLRTHEDFGSPDAPGSYAGTLRRAVLDACKARGISTNGAAPRGAKR